MSTDNKHVDGAQADLYKAAATNDIETAKKLLIDQGADVNECQDSTRFGQTPLFIAASHGHVDMVRFLLLSDEIKVEANLGRELDGQTPLHVSLRKQKFEIAMLLIESFVASGLDIDACDTEGWSALMYLSRYCCGGGDEGPAIARLLLCLGADVNIRSKGNERTFVF
jgi:ankyrin repeat protein